MTAQEMHIGVITQLEQIASYAFADFQTEEVDYYINRTVSKWLRGKQMVIRNMETSSPEYVSASEDIYSVIESIIFSIDAEVTEGSLNTSTLYSGAMRADLSSIPDDDFYLYLLSRSRVDSEWRNNDLVTPNKFIEYATTSYDQPYFRMLPASIQGVNLLVLKSLGDTLLDKVLLTYIRKPAKVALDVDTPGNSVDCDLPEHVHDEIVDLTVQSMLIDLRAKQEE